MTEWKELLLKRVTVQLKPTNNRLRQLIRDHGDIWIPEGYPVSMQCFNGARGVTIKSLDGTHIRNVRYNEDIETVYVRSSDETAKLRQRQDTQG